MMILVKYNNLQTSKNSLFKRFQGEVLKVILKFKKAKMHILRNLNLIQKLHTMMLRYIQELLNFSQSQRMYNNKLIKTRRKY